MGFLEEGVLQRYVRTGAVLHGEESIQDVRRGVVLSEAPLPNEGIRLSITSPSNGSTRTLDLEFEGNENLGEHSCGLIDDKTVILLGRLRLLCLHIDTNAARWEVLPLWTSAHDDESDYLPEPLPSVVRLQRHRPTRFLGLEMENGTPEQLQPLNLSPGFVFRSHFVASDRYVVLFHDPGRYTSRLVAWDTNTGRIAYQHTVPHTEFRISTEFSTHLLLLHPTNGSGELRHVNGGQLVRAFQSPSSCWLVKACEPTAEDPSRFPKDEQWDFTFDAECLIIADREDIVLFGLQDGRFLRRPGFFQWPLGDESDRHQLTISGTDLYHFTSQQWSRYFLTEG